MSIWLQLFQTVLNLFCAPKSPDKPQQPTQGPPQHSQQPQWQPSPPHISKPHTKPPGKKYQASIVWVSLFHFSEIIAFVRTLIRSTKVTNIMSPFELRQTNMATKWPRLSERVMKRMKTEIVLLQRSCRIKERTTSARWNSWTNKLVIIFLSVRRFPYLLFSRYSLIVCCTRK